jgi:hypothetical protein
MSMPRLVPLFDPRNATSVVDPSPGSGLAPTPANTPPTQLAAVVHEVSDVAVDHVRIVCPDAIGASSVATTTVAARANTIRALT